MVCCYGGDDGGDFHPRSASQTYVGGQTGDTLGAAIEFGELVFCWHCYKETWHANTCRFTEYDPAINSAAMSRAQRHVDGLLNLLVAWESWRRLPYNWQECRVEWHTACGQKSSTGYVCRSRVWEEGVAISPKEVTAIQAEIWPVEQPACVCWQHKRALTSRNWCWYWYCWAYPRAYQHACARGSGNIASAPAMSRRQAESCFWTSYVIRGSWQKTVSRCWCRWTGDGKHDTGSGNSQHNTGRDPEEVVGIGANLPTDKRLIKLMLCVGRLRWINQILRWCWCPGKSGWIWFGRNSWSELGAASCGLPVLLDGFLSYAVRSQPARCLLQSNRISFLLTVGRKRRAYSALAFGAGALSHMDMRLGEGSGAALAMSIIEVLVRYTTTWANLLPVILFYREYDFWFEQLKTKSLIKAILMDSIRDLGKGHDASCKYSLLIALLFASQNSLAVTYPLPPEVAV